MYVFEDARSCQIRSWNPHVSLHASSELIGALSGCPIGGSINFSRSKSIQVMNTFPGRMVWAAQYQRVDARYMKASADAAVPDPFATIRLWPDTFSKGQLRGSESEYAVVNVGISSSEAEEKLTSDDSTSAEQTIPENRSAPAIIDHEPLDSLNTEPTGDDHPAEYTTDLLAALDMFEAYYTTDDD